MNRDKDGKGSEGGVADQARRNE